MSDPYTDIAVDFNKKTGALRHTLHCNGQAPTLHNRVFTKKDRELQEMNFYAARTHDWALVNPGQRMIDTHFVFPLMHLDAKDPENYYFASSDAAIELCRNVGMKVFYRLGTSIEHSAGYVAEGHFNSLVPEDFDQYAEVLAGIVRHYTRGWANGFEYKDMEYWEIWNEPDLFGKMWCGTREEFIRLFITVFKRLKSEFPELKIGGPALTGLNLDYFGALLGACKEAGVAPDFISWHCYGNQVRATVGQAQTARDFLDERGLTATQTILNEWHFITGGWEGVTSASSPLQRKHATTSPQGMHGIDSACYTLSCLCEFQKSPLDYAFYYGIGTGAWGYSNEYGYANKNNYAMRMFGRFLAEAQEKVETLTTDPLGTVFALGAIADDGSARMIVADYQGEKPVIEVEVAGMENKKVSVVMMNDQINPTPVDAVWDGSRLTLIKNSNGSAAFYVTFK